VGYPVAGEKTVRGLVAEYKSFGPAYRRAVQTTLRASYIGHYRRGLIRLLEVFEFRTGRSACQLVIEALALIPARGDVRRARRPARRAAPPGLAADRRAARGQHQVTPLELPPSRAT
jgi:hypothetical protein